MASIRHSVIATKPNRNSKEVSKDAWNDEHVLSGTPDTVLGFDALGESTELPVSDFLTSADLTPFVTDVELSSNGGSALVGFLQAGTGANARTIQDKLREAVSVKDFGAVGDGVADDLLPLQEAITNGQPIFFPPGTYAVSAKLNSSGNLFMFAVPGTVTITALGSGIPLILGNPSSPFGSTSNKVFIAGINFDGGNVRTVFPYATNVGGTYKAVTGIQLCADPDGDDTEFVLHDCRFSNFASLPFVVDHFKLCDIFNLKTLRTKDCGFRFCSNIKWVNCHAKYSADNGVSFSRGCKNVVVANYIAEDCEVNGLWLAGFSVPGTGALTVSGASYTVGSQMTMTASGGASFSIADKYTMMTLVDGSSNTAVVKIIGVTNSSTATVVAVTAVPAGLQNIASSSWTRAPMTGVDGFSISNAILIGSYVAGINCGIAPASGSVSGPTILRSGVIADSEISTTGTIESGSNQLTLTDATNFPALSWILIKPKTSLSKYFIARISSKLGNVLTLDRNAPSTFASEEVRLAHANMTEGYAIYATGNGTGVSSFAQNIDFRGVTAIDYRANAVQLGSSTLTPIRNMSFNDCTFRDPSSIQRSTSDGVEAIFRIAEPTGSTLEHLVIRNCRTDFTSAAGKYFVRAYVRGTTRKSIVVEDNYTPNVGESNYLQVLNLDNANADITSSYAFSRIDNFGIRTSTADKASQFIALTATELTDLVSTGILKPRCNRIIITPTADLVVNSIDWSHLGTTGLSQCHIENGSATFNITFTHGDATIRCPGNTNVVLPPRDYVSFFQRNSTISYKMM